MHYFSTLFGKELYVLRTDLQSIIRSLNTVFTANGICHTVWYRGRDGPSRPRYQTVNIISMTTTICCEYSIKTPDDGQ